MSNLDILDKFNLSLILGCNYFFNLGFMKKLGRNIRIIREIRNLTQESLAQAIGYSQKHISRTERGQIQLNKACIERIAEALDVSPQKLKDFDYKSLLEE